MRFRPSGTFALDGANRVIIRRSNLPTEPGVYAFIERGIAYIGHTAKSTLDIRVTPYMRMNYHAHRPVFQELLAALKEGRRVSILTLPVRPRLWRELEVSDTFGIEQALILRFKPPWNLPASKQNASR
jgi:hypothetical protein